MDIFEGIGNFFGGLFNQKKKEEERRASRPVVLSQPRPQQTPQQNVATVREPDAIAFDKPEPIPQLGGVSQDVQNRMSPEVRRQIAARDEAARKAKADVWNPFAIGGDILNAAGGAAKAAGQMGAGMVTDLGNRAADFGEAGATVIGELNGENRRLEDAIQTQANEKQRMADSFAQRARTATTQEDFDKYATMARSLATGASDDADRITTFRNENLANTDPAKTLSNAGMTALDLATLGKGKMILEGTKLGAKVTLPVLQQLAKNTGISGLQGGLIGGTYGGLATVKDPAAEFADYLNNIGMGTMLGAGLGVGAQVALPVAAVAGKNIAGRATNYGLMPPTNLTPDELVIANKVRQAQEGMISPQDITTKEALVYRDIQKKLGGAPGTPDAEMAVVDALGAQRTFDMKRGLRKDATLDTLEKTSDFAKERLMPAGSIKKVTDPAVTPASPAPEKPPAITSPNRPAAPETVMFSGRPHTVVDTLDGMGEPKHLLRDENGKEIWTNPAGLETARQTPLVSPETNTLLDAFDTPKPVEAPVPTLKDMVVEEVVPPKPPVKEMVVEPKPTGELGTIARKAVEDGRLKSDADALTLQNEVEAAMNAEAVKAGSTIEEINKKIQDAWVKKLDNYKDAGLTKEQYDVSLKAADEMMLLRNRADPKLIKGGQIEKFYSPRQAEDTPFTQELVNEISRDKVNGLKNSELDFTARPTGDAIRRYANATDATSNQLFDAVEKKVVKSKNGDDMVVETGIKVSEETKRAVKPDIDEFVAAQDKAIKAASDGDAKAINDAIGEADTAINNAIKKIAKDAPGTAEGRAAVEALTGTRQSYQQSTIRTNMFLNITNRAYDQVAKAVVNTTDKALPIAAKVASKMLKESSLATGRTSRKLANKYAKGAMINQLNRSFKTNVSLAGAGSTNPLMKGVAKLDSAYRSAGTYITSLGDTTTNAVRATNLAILGDAQAKGITGKAELEAYLVKQIGSPEYQGLYHDMTNVYSGYIGMPETITGISPGAGRFSKSLSKVDNAVKNALKDERMNWMPERAKQELNDLVMPAVTGFAGATNRIAQKGLNAMLLGYPQIKAGLKLAASDMPHSKAVGEMMIARSLIDAVSAAGIGAGGLLLGSQGHWTGSYPSDANERARWEKDGIQANSLEFVVGDSKLYIQPGRILGALALPLVIPTVVADAIKDGTDPGDAVGQMLDGTLGQFMSNLGADAIVQHIGDFGNLMNGNEQEKKQAGKSIINMLGYSISNVVPASGLQNNVANAMDENKRDTSGGIVDVVKARNPVTRGDVPVKTDVLGNPIKNNARISGGSAALTTGSNNESPDADKLGAEIDRMSKLGTEVMPAKGAENADIGTNQEIAKLLIDSGEYKAASEESKAVLLKEALLGTKVKDVNKSLAGEEKLYLAQSLLRNEQQREVWMENNDNALGYYDARLKNERANGTLTQKDLDLGTTGSLAQKYTIAKVNKDNNIDQALILSYKNTTKTEFKNITDADLKAKLQAYDDALAAAGLPRKFGTSGSGGSGGGSGGAKKNFAFASLPTSLTGVDSSKSKYADSAPLFKPIADLKAPAVPEIPKGRNISVKRGRSL